MNPGYAVGAAFSIFLFGGCTSEKHVGRSDEIIPSGNLPPLPGDYVPGKALVSGVAKVSDALQPRVIVAWSNEPSPWASNYFTGIQATSDFTNWSEVARVAYQPQGNTVLTNRPAMEFYRVYNAIGSL